MRSDARNRPARVRSKKRGGTRCCVRLEGVNADTSQGARAARGFPRCNGTQVSKFGLCERCRRLLRMRVLCELVIAQCVLRDVGEVLVSLKYH